MTSLFEVLLMAALLNVNSSQTNNSNAASGVVRVLVSGISTIDASQTHLFKRQYMVFVSSFVQSPMENSTSLSAGSA